MTTQPTVLAITDSSVPPRVVEQAARCLGMNVAVIAHTASAACDHIRRLQPAVIALDSSRYPPTAFETIRDVLAEFPDVKIILFGRGPDIAVMAKAVVAGAWNYASAASSPEDLTQMLADASAGKPASADSPFGRVRASIPNDCTAKGSFVMPDGRLRTPKDAILGCASLGLSPQDIKTHFEALKKSTTTQPQPPDQSKPLPSLDCIEDLLRPRKSQPIGGSSTRAAVFGGDRSRALVTVVLLFCGLWSLRLLQPRPKHIAIVPVTGRVFQDGTPLAQAVVVLVPDGGSTGLMATGVTDDLGRYSITTEGLGQGAMPGRYRVTIHHRPRTPNTSDTGASESASGNPFEESLPAKYSSRYETVLRAHVEGARVSADFDLD